MKVELEGLDEVLANLRSLARRYPEAGGEALYEEGLRVDADMVPRIPVDSGRTRDSHYVTEPQRLGSETSVEIGVATDYAPELHERTEDQHPVGEAKFLEHAFAATSAGMASRMAARIRELVESGSAVGGKRSSPSKPRRGGASRSAGRGRGKRR